jgi:hypothetical protein
MKLKKQNDIVTEVYLDSNLIEEHPNGYIYYNHWGFPYRVENRNSMIKWPIDTVEEALVLIKYWDWEIDQK